MDEQDDLIFNNNVLYMKSLVGKLVEIQTRDKASYTGIVFVIDPIYKTTVLHSSNSKDPTKKDNVIIPYAAVKSLQVLSEDVVDSNYLEKTTPVSLNEEIKMKKARLKKWFQQMCIDVVESGDCLKVSDHLIVLPPYEKENCISNNTIVLEKIMKLVDMMPTDFN